MNKRLITLMAAALALLSASGQVEFTGVGQYHVIEVEPEMSTSALNKIYVVYNTQGVGMTYTATTDQQVVWYTFDSYPTPIDGITRVGNVTTLPSVKSNCGYIIEEGTERTFYCWVVNYADYYPSFNGLSWNSESSCSLVSFDFDGRADAIPYYNKLNGDRQVLDREIKLSYNTLEWDDSTHWQEKEVVETFAALDQAFQIEPPLCNTVFMLSGDRFLEEWGIDVSIWTDTYLAQAVNCGTTAVLMDDDGSEEKLEGGLTAGSAPARIVFTGYPTDAVAYRKWEMATDPDFEDVILQYNQDEVDYTFNDAGTYYVRYMVANASGTCEYYGETYTITMSESQLGVGARGDLPNVFSPGSTEGVNDVWKVSYKSLVEFHCWIYNRWGTLMYEYTDPDGGWDGTYKGRLVDTGVYYYVVTATGSDGVKYKKRGDITILRYKRGASGTSGNGTGGLDTGGY